MNWLAVFFKSSIGKKITMAASGLFLISFLVVHASINALVFYNDGGATFNIGAHFMGTNPVIRTIEILLIALLIVHIIQGLILWNENRKARSIRYAVVKPPRKSPWYSRSMALLGTLILLFLIMHTSFFWIPNRVSQLVHGEELPLYAMMREKFHDFPTVVLYVLGCFSLFWHLLHGFRSAFQTLGLSRYKYIPLIRFCGTAFSIIVPLALAMIPVSFFFGWIK